MTPDEQSELAAFVCSGINSAISRERKALNWVHGPAPTKGLAKQPPKRVPAKPPRPPKAALQIMYTVSEERRQDRSKVRKAIRIESDMSAVERTALRAWISAFKLERGCIDCGYKGHPAALEFDHLPQFKKLGSICDMMAYAGREAIVAEMGKCQVVCSNCHRVRTYVRTAARAGRAGLK